MVLWVRTQQGWRPMASGCCPLAKARWVLLSWGSHHSAVFPVGKREVTRLLKLHLELDHIAATTVCRSQQVSEPAQFPERRGMSHCRRVHRTGGALQPSLGAAGFAVPASGSILNTAPQNGAV